MLTATFVLLPLFYYLMIKKYYILIASAMLTYSSVHAQTEVTTGIMLGKDYGVTYFLPQTELVVELHTTRHLYTPGKFCQYADKYLRINDVTVDAYESWTLDKVEIRLEGVPDKNKTYFVKLKDKTTAPLMELTEDGIVRSINMPFSGEKKQTTITPPQKTVTASVDPRKFLTEEMLITGSNAKMAELVAKEIYNIRESKNALLRGEADNMPQDGTQLKLMLDNLNLQEQAMTEMFTGTHVQESHTSTLRITPEAMKDEVVFRFSQRLGIVDKDDLAGEPYYLTITDLKNPVIPTADSEDKDKKKNKRKDKKELMGIAYNVPGRAKVTLTQLNTTLYEGEFPITQFGSVEYLAEVLFNKNTVTKVQFNTTTGALLKIEREEKK